MFFRIAASLTREGCEIANRDYPSICAGRGLHFGSVEQLGRLLGRTEARDAQWDVILSVIFDMIRCS